MKRLFFTVIIMLLSVSVSTGQELLDEEFEKAYRAWDVGDYIPALEGFRNILQGQKADRFFERIALMTGELYTVAEVAPDGRNLRFSPDGRYAVFETSDQGTSIMHIIDVHSGLQEIAEIRGSSLVFSPAGGKAAYFKVRETADLKDALKELETIARQQPVDRQALRTQQQKLRWLQAQNTEIVVRDLNSDREQRLNGGGLIKTALAYGAGGERLYFAGGAAGGNACDIYAVSESSQEPEKITSGDGFKTSPAAVPGGRYLLYRVVTRNPLPQPAGSAPSRRGRGGGAAGGEFVVYDLETGAAATFSGSSPVVSADGSTLAFLNRQDGEYEIDVVKLQGSMEPVAVKKSAERIESPALSPDGGKVVFDIMYQRNYEVFVINSDGTGESRLSRDTQHDRFPRFITPDKVLAARGEGRHRRSYLYDINSLASVKLFHNNTVRTIAPEYEWAANSDGTQILIQSERDGDTISPERGVYLVDLTKKITRNELLARIERNLKSERKLHEIGEKMFRPLYGQVSSLVERISITKLYEYQKALFDFDSKYVSQPGNQPAGEYIYATLKSFGYAPEYQWLEVRNVRTANVLATLRGTENPELVYVLSSHYDSNQRGPGADDNSSGVAVLLETARVLAETPMPATIIFAAFTGEEAGLYGSRYFVEQAAAGNMNLAGALNNDMIGWCNDHHLDNTIRYSNAGIRDLQHAAAFLFSNLITYDSHYYKSTDAAAYYDAYGDIVGGIGSYPVLGNPYYHQPTDLLETVNHQLVCETAKTTAASMIALASSPARVKNLTIDRIARNALDISWTPSPEKGITRYVVAYGTGENPMQVLKEVNQHAVSLPLPEFMRGETVYVAVKAVNERGLESWDWARVSSDAGMRR